MQTSQESNCGPDRPAALGSSQRLLAAAVAVAMLAFLSFVFWAARSGFDFLRLSGPCGFKQHYQLPCPTCGMTTAFLEFSRGHVLGAFSAQPAGAILFLAVIVVAAGTMYYALTGRQIKAIHDLPLRYIIFMLLIILAAGWAVTLARTIAGWQ